MEQKAKNTIQNVYVKRTYFKAETKTSVLLYLNETTSIWVDKKFIKNSDYCLTSNVGIIKEWKYKNATNPNSEPLTGDGVLFMLSKLV